MTKQEWIKEINKSFRTIPFENMVVALDNIFDEVAQEARLSAIEECAKVAIETDGYEPISRMEDGTGEMGYTQAVRDIAKAIRNLKEAK